MSNASFPKISDLINISEGINFGPIFSYAWTFTFGSWFFAIIIGIIGGALFLKTQNPLPPIVMFIVTGLILSDVMEYNFMYMIGVLGMFTIGFMLYKVFIMKE